MQKLDNCKNPFLKVTELCYLHRIKIPHGKNKAVFLNKKRTPKIEQKLDHIFYIT